MFYESIILESILQMDTDGSGHIDASELGYALELVGIKLAGFQVRDLLQEHDSKIRDGKLDIDEFRNVSFICIIVHVYTTL